MIIPTDWRDIFPLKGIYSEVVWSLNNKEKQLELTHFVHSLAPLILHIAPPFELLDAYESNNKSVRRHASQVFDVIAGPAGERQALGSGTSLEMRSSARAWSVPSIIKASGDAANKHKGFYNAVIHLTSAAATPSAGDQDIKLSVASNYHELASVSYPRQ